MKIWDNSTSVNFLIVFAVNAEFIRYLHRISHNEHFIYPKQPPIDFTIKKNSMLNLLWKHERIAWMKIFERPYLYQFWFNFLKLCTFWTGKKHFQISTYIVHWMQLDALFHFFFQRTTLHFWRSWNRFEVEFLSDIHFYPQGPQIL